jgi:hypothetical protein
LAADKELKPLGPMYLVSESGTINIVSQGADRRAIREFSVTETSGLGTGKPSTLRSRFKFDSQGVTESDILIFGYNPTPDMPFEFFMVGKPGAGDQSGIVRREFYRNKQIRIEWHFSKTADPNAPDASEISGPYLLHDKEADLFSVGYLRRRFERDRMMSSSGKWDCIVESKNMEKILTQAMIRFGRTPMVGTENYIFKTAFELKRSE